MRSIRRRGRVAEKVPAADPRVALEGLLPEIPRDRIGEVWSRLRACTHPRFYAAQLSAEELAPYGGRLDLDSTVAHYLAHGARAGKRPSVIFHPQTYADRLAERGLRLPDGAVPFLHWLSVGWDARIVPTPLFDEAWYRKKHPQIVRAWGFAQYVDRGLYEPQWRPSPLGRHHAGMSVPNAAQEHAPLLLPEMLHRAADHDLTRTSWLEEGCLRALETCATLRSPRVQDLIAKAAAIEPLIEEGVESGLAVTCPPYRAPRLFMAEQAEALRRRVGMTHVDTVVVVPDLTAATIAGVAGQLAAALREAEPAASVLLAAADTAAETEADASRGAATSAVPGLPPGIDVLDLGPFAVGFDEERRVDLLLDLVRGLTARRIVTAGSRVGWRLLAAYGRQLSTAASLGACLEPPERTEQGNLVGFAVKEFQEAFADLDWALVTTAELAADLINRYLLSGSLRQRLVTAYAEDGTSDADGSARQIEAAAVKRIVADGERREEQQRG